MLPQDLLDLLQGASNSAAGAVSGPVDLIGAGLRAVGVPVGPAPVGGSAWMAQRGLTAQPKNQAAGLAGETLGLLAPTVAAAKAPQIARGLLDAAENAAKPATLGRQRGVVPVEWAREHGGAVRLPDDPLFAQAVANTPGASIGDDGLLMAIARTQKPEQALAPSARGGVFYLPQGSKDARHFRRPTANDSNSLSYGGSDAIAGTTAIRRPLFVKGSVGGKAPEAALDKLAGKGTYRRAREEALSADPKDARVRAYLEKWAPELADLAPDIVGHSRQGNQLPYALQEAAVASAMRRAGHDAVIGYGVRRGGAGPFISEVFDVRERLYPNTSGAFGVWDELPLDLTRR